MIPRVRSDFRVRSLCETDSYKTWSGLRKYHSSHPIIMEFENLNKRFGNYLDDREIEFFERYLSEPETTGVQFCKEYFLTKHELNVCLKNIIDTLWAYLHKAKNSIDFIEGKYVGCYHILNAIEQFTNVYGIKYFSKTKRKHFYQIYVSTDTKIIRTKGRKHI